MSALRADRDDNSLSVSRGASPPATARLLRGATGAKVAVPDINYPVHARWRTSDMSVLRQVFIVFRNHGLWPWVSGYAPAQLLTNCLSPYGGLPKAPCFARGCLLFREYECDSGPAS
jgi:hypothetical protein